MEVAILDTFSLIVKVGTFLHRKVQTDFESNLASYPMCTRRFLREFQRGRRAEHSPKSSAEVTKSGYYTFVPPYAFMASRLIYKGIFNFLLSFQTKTKLRDLSPQAKHTGRATAACRRS
jgi:hypothetical protein